MKEAGRLGGGTGESLRAGGGRGKRALGEGRGEDVRDGGREVISVSAGSC
jgi:hypothetical protein